MREIKDRTPTQITWTDGEHALPPPFIDATAGDQEIISP